MQIQKMSKLSLTLGFGMMSTMFILFNKNENSDPLRAVNTLMRKGMGHTFCLILLFLEYRYLSFRCSSKMLPSRLVSLAWILLNVLQHVFTS